MDHALKSVLLAIGGGWTVLYWGVFLRFGWGTLDRLGMGDDVLATFAFLIAVIGWSIPITALTGLALLIGRRG